MIGSPDIDVMDSDSLPSLLEVRERYGIPWDRYGILIFHPVTTERERNGSHARLLVDLVKSSTLPYVVIFPNNDLGSEEILSQYERFRNCDTVKVFPSLRFEYFLTLLKHCELILGNSSAGVREAPHYGVPSVNVGTRQAARSTSQRIINIETPTESTLQSAVGEALIRQRTRYGEFGDGRSAERFLELLNSQSFWEVPLQKRFVVDKAT